MSEFVFSKRIEAVAPSATLAVTALAKTMRDQGIDVLALSAGEPDFDTPANIRQAAHAAIDAGKSKYTPVPGTPELRAAVAAWANQTYGAGAAYSASQVIVGAGGKQVLFNAFAALLDTDDEVIFSAPYWVSYPDMARFAGAVPRIIETDETRDFLASAEQIEAAITPKSKLIVINSPSNPTGTAYTAAQLEQIAAVLRKHPRIFIITDDIYGALTYDAAFVSLAHLAPDLRGRMLIASGVSKTYAMTGWRVGYGLAPAAVIEAMSRLQGASTSGASSIAQAAALEAVAGPQDEVERMRAIFKQRRDRMVAGLRAIDRITVVNPTGAFYVFPRVDAYYSKALPDSSALCTHLLEKSRLAVVPGLAFGSDAYIRISFACSNDDIDEGLKRLREGLAALGS